MSTLSINPELQKHLLKQLPINDGVQYVFVFGNGYGASIVQHSFSYGGEKGLWEIAVLNKDGEISYETPITADVIGWQTQEEVADVLFAISKLS